MGEWGGTFVASRRMRSVLRLALALLLTAPVALAQPDADPRDVSTIDGIIEAYYEVVSGPAGQPRDWARDSTLHLPQALVTIVRTGERGETVLDPVDLGTFHAQSDRLVETGFFEREVSREVQRYGATAHVWSTYEWRTTENGPRGGRGINSIQLVWDGVRWWIVSWMFDGRTDAPPIPREYL